MLAAGMGSLVLTVLLGWWGKPVNGVVSPRIEGWDFYYSSIMFGLVLLTLALLVLGLGSLS